MKIPSYTTNRSQRGLSLIELMIALLIGIIVLFAVVQVFLASRSSYQLSQSIARNQESSRFAMDFLSRDIRMAGHAGCTNDQSLLSGDATGPTGGNIRTLFLSEADRNTNNVSALAFPLRFDVAIQGFEAAGTSIGSTLNISGGFASGGAGNWSPALPAELSGLNPVRGSDIVVLRFFSPEESAIENFDLAGSPTITYPSEAVAGRTKVATEGHGLYALADCQAATVFQASAAPTATGMLIAQAGLNKSGIGFAGKFDGAVAYSREQTALFRAETMAYYVRLNADGVPALYRTRWTTAPGTAVITPVTEEMVEGVESLQMLYGEDSAAITDVPTGYIDQFSRADEIGGLASAARWRRVGSVKLSMLVRGVNTDRRAAEQARNSPVVNGVTVTVPADGQFRAVYDTTIALRNRLFGN